jgi:hypothetical protein
MFEHVSLRVKKRFQKPLMFFCLRQQVSGSALLHLRLRLRSGARFSFQSWRDDSPGRGRTQGIIRERERERERERDEMRQLTYVTCPHYAQSLQFCIVS